MDVVVFVYNYYWGGYTKMDKKFFRKLFAIIISFLLTNTLTAFAEIRSTNGTVVLPEYQQTDSSFSINDSLSEEEKEGLLKKYFVVDFKQAKALLEKDGYRVVQDPYQSNTWVVGKTYDDGFWAGMTLSGDNNKINVSDIESLFDTYNELRTNGYQIQCSNLTESYLYFSHGKSPYGATQITDDTWTISKDNTTIKMQALDATGKPNISLSAVNTTIKFEKAKAQFEKDGYTVVKDPYQSNTWVVGKTYSDRFWVGMTLSGEKDINVFNIESLFDTYNKLRKNGYQVQCSNLTESYLYFSHGKSPYGAAQITDATWTISKNGQSLKLTPVKNNAVSINIENVNRAFSIVKSLNGEKLSGYKYSAKFSGNNLVISRTKNSTTQTFKLNLNNYFGNQALSKFNSASKINSNFTTLKTAVTTYNKVLDIIKSLRSKIDLNISKLKANKITSSLLNTIKKTEKAITNLISSLSTKITSLKKVLNTDTYNSISSAIKTVSKKAKSLNSEVNSLTTKNVNSKKANILSMLSSLKTSINTINKSKQEREISRFEKAKMQLNEDGYTLIQNTKNSWRVEKQINGTTTYLTIYPFNEKGECTVNVNSIKGLFNAYEKLKNEGYTITCEGKTNQISGNVWNISKGNITISVQAFDDNGKINVSINNINKFFKEKEEQAKFETAISKLSKDGYRVIHDAYNNDAWVIEKKINGTTTCLTVYPFNEKGECTIDTNAIEGLFAAYEKLKNASYSVNCSGKTDLYYYFSLGKGQYFEQITSNDWTITKDNFSMTLNPFGDTGKVDIYERIKSFFVQNTEQQISQLKEKGYGVEQDKYNKDSFIVRKGFYRYSMMYLQVHKTEQNSLNMDVETVIGLFNAYQNITNAGYQIYFLSSENLSKNASPTDNGVSSVLLTQGNWLIMKDDSVVSVNPIKEDGTVITVEDIEKNGTVGNFEKTVKTLTSNGFDVQQDPFDKKAWIVSKKIGSKQICLTVYFNEEENAFNLSNENIENLFSLYQKATSKGYELIFTNGSSSYSDSLKFYSNLRKSYVDFQQINTGNWTFFNKNVPPDSQEAYKIYKVLKDDGSVISPEELEKPEITESFQQKMDKLKSEGYELHQESYTYSKNSWVISRELFGEKVCMSVYHYDGQDDFDTKTEDIEKVFNSYEDIVKSGYAVKSSDYTLNSYYYEMQERGEDFIKISNDIWFIYDDQEYAFINPAEYTNSNDINFSKDSLRENIKQLYEDGYKVEHNKNDERFWTISKQINTKMLYFDVAYNPQKGFDVPIENIEGLFDAYEKIIAAGGEIFFKSSNQNDFVSNDMKETIQLNSDNWEISKDGYTILLNSSKSIQKFGELFSALKEQQIDALDIENDELTLKVLFSNEFAEFCEQNKNFNDILKQYNLSISVGRKIYEVVGKKLKDIQEEQFGNVLTETLNYYKEIFEIASSIDMLSNDIAIYSLHNSETWSLGGQRFSPKGLNDILNILNIAPIEFESTELYKISPNLYEQNVEDFLNKIVNFNESGYEKALFVFDGHGAKNGFYYDDSKHIGVNEISQALIQAYNNGVNLENLIIYFSSCESYYFVNNIIDNLKSAGIEKFPQFIAEAGKETELGYTARKGVSNLEFAIISDLKKKSSNELENMFGHLTMEQVANCPMYLSNHTVLITNSQIEQLNEEYVQKIGTIVGDANINSSHNPYVELQTEKTVEILENIAETLNLENPKEFKYTTLGVALGVIIETFDFMQASDTENSPSFENQHRNLTPEQESVIQKIRELTKEAESAVINSPISNSLAVPAAILTEWITHFIYNKLVINEQELLSSNKNKDIVSVLLEKFNTEFKTIIEPISNLLTIPATTLTEFLKHFAYNEFDIFENGQDKSNLSLSINNMTSNLLKDVNTELKKIIEPIIGKFFKFLQDINIL